MGRNSPYKEVYLWECKCPAASIHSQNLDLCNLPAWIENQNHKIVISIYQKISKQTSEQILPTTYALYISFVITSTPNPLPSHPSMYAIPRLFVYPKTLNIQVL